MMHIDAASIVALCLIVAVLLLGWRGRQSPGGDRALLEDHSRLKSRVISLEESFKGCATKSDMAVLSAKMDALEEHAASAGDINALEGKVNTVMAKVEAVEKAADRTEQGVQRIENFFIQKGMER